VIACRFPPSYDEHNSSQGTVLPCCGVTCPLVRRVSQ
jgi:hypothetical protein